MGGGPSREECLEAGFGHSAGELLAQAKNVVGQQEDRTTVHSSSGFHLLEFAGDGTTGAFLWGLLSGILLAAAAAIAQRQTGWCSPKQAKLARKTHAEIQRL